MGRAMQYLWGTRYIDDIIMHREDHDGDGSFTDTGTERWWHLSDVQFSTVAIVDDAANLAERVRYDSYGRALHHESRDVDGDRDYDSADRSIIVGIAGSPGNGIGQPNYKVEADLNRDGVVNLTDVSIATTNYVSALPVGDLSNSTVKNTIGWDGYVFNPETSGGGLYHVRFRWYSTELGRWLERDPRPYIDSSNLYQYAVANPLRWTDSKGLTAGPPDPPPPGWTTKPEYIGTPTQTYCRAAKKYPNNDWLQCVCRVSREINLLIAGLEASLTPFFVAVHEDRAHIKRTIAKMRWFKCMNTCMERKWLAGYKVFQGDALNPDESEHLIDAWRECCNACPTPTAAATKKCCEKQVEAG